MQRARWAKWADAALLVAALGSFAPAIGEEQTGAASRPLAEAKVAPGTYFPNYLLTASRGCDGEFGNQPVLTDFTSQWYSSQLKVAGDRALVDVAAAAPDKIHVRFTWLRSFDRPVFVRIDEQPDGTARIEARLLSGAGGYEPGKIAKRVSRDLTASEWTAFNVLLNRSNLQAKPAGDCNLGLDGAQWVLETVTDGHYAFFDYWSPDDGAVREVGLAMLKLTGFPLEPIY